MRFDKEFKEALINLPAKEKDKLLLRLLKKDIPLVNRLYYELLDTRTVDDRRLEIEIFVKGRIESFSEHAYSPGYLMMELREISGNITEHVKITKDKFGEVSLNLLMLNKTLELNNASILEATQFKARKLSMYVIARAFKILILIQKLHEDLLLDFSSDLKKLGKLISENHYLMKTAIQNGLDVNWLIRVAIPEDIEQIHKELRSRGYLTNQMY